MDPRVLDFIEEAAGAQGVATLNAAFARVMADFGIGKFAAAILDPVAMRPEHFLASNYPNDWIDHYTQAGYDKVDPVVRRSLLERNAFVWADSEAPAPARQLFAEAAQAGIVSGLAVPIRLRNGQHGVVSVTSELPTGQFRHLMATAQASVQTAIYCYHDTLCDLAGIGRHRPDPMPRLEAEIVRRLADGAGIAAIASRLAMPECAVERHIANAMVRLNLTSPDHLVAEAHRRGLVA